MKQSLKTALAISWAGTALLTALAVTSGRGRRGRWVDGEPMGNGSDKFKGGGKPGA